MDFGPNPTKSNVNYNGNPLKTIEILKIDFEIDFFEAETKISKSPTQISPYTRREHTYKILAPGSAWCSRNEADNEPQTFVKTFVSFELNIMGKQWETIAFPFVFG